MSEYWVPRFKHVLVTELSRLHPSDAAKFRRMRKAQLYAIWHSVWRRRLEGGSKSASGAVETAQGAEI